jgi:hypothetical protein
MRPPLHILLIALTAAMSGARIEGAGDVNVVSRAFTIAPPSSLLPKRTVVSRAFTIAPPNSLLASRTAVSRAFTIAPEGSLLPNQTAVSRAFTIAPPGSLLPTRTAVSRAFTIAPEAGKACQLQVAVTSPQNGSTFAAGHPTFLAAQAYFGQPPYAFAWASSLDGPLGTGPSLTISTLSPGDHQITATVQDAGQDTGQDSVNITVIAAADLTVPYSSAPTSGLAGTIFTVSWTVANHGTVTAVGPWPDTVFISTDATLSPGDPSLGSLQAPESLALPPGASYASGVFATWPAPGTYWLFVRTDVNNAIPEYSGESNNVGMIGPISIEAQPLPDATVAQVTPPPADIPSGTATSVTYSVQNQGAAATIASWTDRVLLHGPGLPAGGLVLAQPGNLLLLPPGQGYTRNVAVTLPHDVQGAFTIEVRADANAVMVESNEQNNAATSGAFAVALEPQPDLVVLNVTAPLFGFSGGPISAGWTILNAGAGVTDNGAWQHAIYLSSDADPAITPGDVLLAVTGPAGVAPLPAAGSAPFSHAATIPASIWGLRYVKVLADSGNVISEQGFDANNVTASVTPIDISPTFSPDLVPLSVTAAAPLPYPGHALDVTWSVINDAAPPLNPASWVDAIYLSPDPVLDAGDHFLGGFVAATAPDGFGGHEIPPYTRQRTTTIPANLAAGPYHVIVHVNQSDGLFEGNCPAGMCEANNVLPSAQPLSIQANFADLAVAVTGPPPSPALAGSGVSVTWEVTNIGPVPTPVAQWQDRIHLSLDATLDAGDALLKSVNHTGALAPGATYQASAEVALPAVSGGPYFLLVQADGGGQVVEPSGAEVNVAASGIVLVALPSDPGAEEIEQQALYAELTVASMAAPKALVAGEPLTAQWTVLNTAEAATNVSVWTDRVWLSSDMTLGGDVLLGALTHAGGLAAGGAYDVNASFPTALDQAGTFFVLVETDATGAVLEIDNANNVAAAPDPTLITAAAAANLVVGAVGASGTAISGQPLGITWTLSNTGEAATNVSSWNESIYLSLNQLLDGGDLHLQTLSSGACGPLAVGESCQRAASVLVPLGVNGLYFVIVRTNSNGAVYEAGRLDDNLGATTVLAQVIVPEPADLVVGAAPPPGGPFVLGEDAAFAWPITNAGPADALGSWLDALFLSSDPVFDLSDAHVGTFANSAPGGVLPAGQSAAGAATTAIPGVLPGLYWIVVRGDVFNNVPETDESNNAGFMLGPIEVSAHLLPLSEPDDPMPASGKLPAGRTRYYEFVAPPGETVRLTLEHDNPSAWTEMFIKHQAIPTSGDFDFSGGAIGAPAQEVVIPSTLPGSYFVLVRSAALPQNPATIGFSLLARRTPFEVTGVHPAVAGAAAVTLTVSGARFDQSAAFALRHVESGALFAPAGTLVESAARARVTFDLTEAPLGPYDVLGSQGNVESVHSGGLTVEPPSDFIVAHELLDLVPGRLGYTTSATLSVRNASNRDIGDAMVALFTADLPALQWSLQGLSEPVGNGDWRVKLAYLRHLPPDETVTFAISVNAGVESGLAAVEYLADVVVLSAGEFEERVQAFAERVRQRVLAGQVALPPGLLDLAEDPEAWWDLLRPLYVTAEILDHGILPPGGIVDCAHLAEPLVLLDGGLADAGMAACLCNESDFCACPAFPPCAGAGELDGGPRDGRELPCNLPVCFGAGNPIALGAGALDCGPGVACQDFTFGEDPNEKDGEDGFGAQQWIGRDSTQSYVIFFENLAEATAPVARVEIRDALDPDLNPASFRVGQISFGGVVVDVPPNRINYFERLDLSGTLGLLVDVFAGVDAGASPPEAFWVIQGLDPATGLPPTDGVSGFLPPNDDGSGQGAVIFTIRPSLNVVNLATIENDASILFDANAPMETSVVTNTVDAEPPVSGIGALPPAVADPAIGLTVAGGDVGSGLASFNLLVTIDGGPLTPFAFTTEGQVTFNGEAGHVYGFISQAIDHAGNAQSIGATPQVVTAVPTVRLAAASDSGVPGDGITSDPTPSLLAVSAPLGDVLFEVNGPGVSRSATATAGPDGRATYTVPSADALPDGAYVVTASGSGVSVQASFTIDGTAPTVLAWRSAADHGALGEVTLLMDEAGATSEPRGTGVSRLLLEFAADGDPVASLLHDGVSILGTNIAGQPVGVGGIDIAVTPRAGTQVLEIGLAPPLPDQALYCVTIDGLRDAAGNAVAAYGVTRQLTALFGDASGDRRVNSTDVGGVILLLGTDPIDPDLPYHVSSDVDQDGDIDEGDLELVLGAVGPDARFIPSPCGLGAVAGLDRFAGLSGLAAMLSPANAASAAPGAAAPAPLGPPAPGGSAAAAMPEAAPPEDDTAAPWWAGGAADGGRLAYFDPSGAPEADPGAAITPLPLAGWFIHEQGGDATIAAAILDRGGYVAPVLAAPGGWAIVTPSALVALAPDCNGGAAIERVLQVPPGSLLQQADWGGVRGLRRVDLPHHRGADVVTALREVAALPCVRFVEPDSILGGAYPLQPPRPGGALLVLDATRPAGAPVAILADGVAPDEPRAGVLWRWGPVAGAPIGPLGAEVAAALDAAAPLGSVQVALPLAGGHGWIGRPSWVVAGLTAARARGAATAIDALGAGAMPSQAVASALRHGACDLDRDGDVDAVDLLILLRGLAAGSGGDLTGDGAADLADVAFLVDTLPAPPRAGGAP